MKRNIQNLLNKYLDIKITRKSTFDRMLADSSSVKDIQLLKSVPAQSRDKCIDLLELSHSQLRQDIFVLSELDFKKEGFFVEFGATNGVTLSNSHLLEKEFGWKGILAEPAKMWHNTLKEVRNAHIETKCVWKTSGEILKFNETDIGELSTIDEFSSTDEHSKHRKTGKRYDVETITLVELLEKYNAPSHIDYLSIDTEGSEYEILKDFNFDKYQFNVITCEHNHTPVREDIYNLLTRHGYVRKFEHISDFDDWYVYSK